MLEAIVLILVVFLITLLGAWINYRNKATLVIHHLKGDIDEGALKEAFKY